MKVCSLTKLVCLLLASSAVAGSTGHVGEPIRRHLLPEVKGRHLLPEVKAKPVSLSLEPGDITDEPEFGPARSEPGPYKSGPEPAKPAKGDLKEAPKEPKATVRHVKVKDDDRVRSASKGYAPASKEKMEMATALFLFCALIFPVIMLCSSCYKAHTKDHRPGGVPAFAKILGEKRTLRMLILPAIACLVCLTMTYLNYQWMERQEGSQVEEGYLASHTVNFKWVEPWSCWVARWSIWFLALFGMVEFKGEILPFNLMWLPLIWGIALVFVIASGVHQWDVYEKGTYASTVWGIPGGVRMLIHVVAANVAFIICWLESVMLWWPNKALHVTYVVLIVSFILSDITSALAAVLEWAVLGLHLVVVWYRAPIVRRQVEQNTFKPWVGCCQWCCPYVEALPGGTKCCPPASVENMDVVGGPVMVDSLDLAKSRMP